jgi:predicted TIM-barrel fold metal-dependent hydrolase
MPHLPKNIIDFHVHLFPDKLFDAIWATFKSHYHWDVVHRLYYRQCIAYLNDRGVSPLVYSNYAHKKGVARGLNDWNASLLDNHPDVYCFAAFHPDDDDCMDLARKILAHPQVLGFKLQLLVQDFYPYDERLFPLFELVSEKNKRLLFHVGTGPIRSQYVGVTNFIKALRRYPNLPATVAHLGAFEYREFFDLLDEHPRLFLDTAFVFLKSPPMRFNLGSEYLEKYRDRIVYGSDFPNLIFPRKEEITTLLEMGLSQEFYDNVFYNNGMSLIKQHAGTNGLTDPTAGDHRHEANK